MQAMVMSVPHYPLSFPSRHQRKNSASSPHAPESIPLDAGLSLVPEDCAIKINGTELHVKQITASQTDTMATGDYFRGVGGINIDRQRQRLSN